MLAIRCNSPNKALVRTQTTLRFVCAAQLSRYTAWSIKNEKNCFYFINIY